MSDQIKLSICIATYNRGNFIAETLDSILPQLNAELELIIVDGCSPDNTEQVMRQYVVKHPEIKYYRESENSGIDRDYDKAVGYAQGEYCWLMTDDDLVKSNALKEILIKLNGVNDLVIVNAEVANINFSKLLDKKLIKLNSNRSYQLKDRDQFMIDAGHGLSFIGCVIIKRRIWLERDRVSYYGSLFIHVGVIFQQSLENIALISEPAIIIRYGNAMWTARSLEIWLIKWPNLIWSFSDFSKIAKNIVCPKSYRKKLTTLFFYRSTGVYDYSLYKRFLKNQANWLGRSLFILISILPPIFLNVVASVYCVLRNKSMKMAMYSLNCSSYQNPISRWATRVIGV